MKIYLSAIHEEQAIAWESAFGDCDDVEVQKTSILDLSPTAVVSPANSFGYMDGGIDMQYLMLFGPSFQSRLQDRIVIRNHGELLVGQALVLETFNNNVPYLISAPTMRVPQRIDDTVNVYLAMRAVLLLIKQEKFPDGDDEGKPIKDIIESIAIPAMGTGVGGLTAVQCAKQMRAAYDIVYAKKVPFPRTISEATDEHEALASEKHRGDSA